MTYNVFSGMLNLYTTTTTTSNCCGLNTGFCTLLNAATQNTGLHCILLCDCIVLSRCLLHFTLLLFALLVVTFISFSVIFSLWATILISLNLTNM